MYGKHIRWSLGYDDIGARVLLLGLGGEGRGRQALEGGSSEHIVVASRQLSSLSSLLGLLRRVLRVNEVARSSDDGDGHEGSESGGKKNRETDPSMSAKKLQFGGSAKWRNSKGQ